MKIGGRAKFVVEIDSREDLPEAAEFISRKNLSWFALGGGSNVIAGEKFDGVILLNKIRGFREISDDDFSKKIMFGSGEILDKIIEKTVRENLSGLEFLSRIPGTIGATPVQNVGAYGAEISDVLTELEAYDFAKKTFVKFAKNDCDFSYRKSIFKDRENRNFFITNITISLSKNFAKPPFYKILNDYFRENPNQNLREKFAKNEAFSPAEIRAAITKIRENKLPDPREIPSAGSFFKNPIVDEKFAKKFLAKFPDAPHFSMSEQREKLAAGWLIDQAGLKNFADFGFQIYPKNALVVTNISRENSAENLAKFRAEIIEKVREKFGVELEQEPENL